MTRNFVFVVLLFAFLGCDQSPIVDSDENAKTTQTSQLNTVPKSRSFKFVYGASLTELEPGTKVRVWLPVATSNHDQQVELIDTYLPATHQMTQEKKFGNQLIYFEARANEDGEVPIEVTYRVTRHELTQANHEAATDDGTTFLKASSMVPTSDEIRSEVLGEIAIDGNSLNVARKIYDGVDTHMKYDKPKDQLGWGQGDAQWACDSRFGNCTDFHSVFISSARNLKIPARFEIGFPIPTEIGSGTVGGYHCWAKFLADGNWVPVDISEADKHPELKEYYFGNLTADRVMFSIGRDLELSPATAADTVNYLSYPYAEVEGKQHQQFRKEFRYEDISE